MYLCAIDAGVGLATKLGVVSVVIEGCTSISGVRHGARRRHARGGHTQAGISSVVSELRLPPKRLASSVVLDCLLRQNGQTRQRRLAGHGPQQASMLLYLGHRSC